MPDDAQWLFVSKPLRAPFRDGSTVLVRDLVAGLSPRFFVTYFGDPQVPLRTAGRVIEAPAMGYRPRLRQKAEVLGNLLWPSHAALPLHFFFTPNRMTSSVLAGLRRLQARRPMVQSVMSSHRATALAPLLAGLDALVVPSEFTRTRLVEAGLSPTKIHRIYPGVATVSVDPGDRPRHQILYAGDLDEDVVDRLLAIARGLQGAELFDYTLTVAARPKTPDDPAHRRRLSQGLDGAIELGRARVLGEVQDMDALLRDAALQIFVADHVRNKVDLPLVLLEGLARGVPLISLDFDPLSEIFRAAAEHRLEVGRAVPPRGSALVQAITEALGDPTARQRWSRAAPELVRRQFSTADMIRRYEELYDECSL